MREGENEHQADLADLAGDYDGGDADGGCGSGGQGSGDAGVDGDGGGQLAEEEEARRTETGDPGAG